MAGNKSHEINARDAAKLLEMVKIKPPKPVKSEVIQSAYTLTTNTMNISGGKAVLGRIKFQTNTIYLSKNSVVSMQFDSLGATIVSPSGENITSLPVYIGEMHIYDAATKKVIDFTPKQISGTPVHMASIKPENIAQTGSAKYTVEMEVYSTAADTETYFFDGCSINTSVNLTVVNLAVSQK